VKLSGTFTHIRIRMRKNHHWNSRNQILKRN